MKLKLSRWLTLPLLAALLSASLAGCTARPSEQELTARFSGLNGIASMKTSCSQPLPWNWDCQIRIATKPKISAADLTNIIRSTGDLRLRITSSSASQSGSELSMDIQERPSDVDAVELAKAYTLAEAQPKLANFRVDRYFGSGSTGYSANLELEASATFNELSRLAAVLADNAVIKQANVLAAKFEINTENNHPPLAEISLFDQIAKKYSVIGGKLSPGALEVRLATSVDRQTAISFASKLPQYKEIDQVYLENNPIIERHKIAQGSAASLESLIDLIRDQPQLKKIEAGGAALNITVPNTALLKKVDDTLSAHPAYHQVLISYTLGRSKVSKPAHLSVPLGVFIKLLEDEDLDSVNMGVSEQDGLNVSVYATQNISAYEMGKLLAVSGLGDPAAQVRVQVSSKTPPEKWSLKFSTADPGHIPDGKKVDANRVKELASGWQAGKDSLGK